MPNEMTVKKFPAILHTLLYVCYTFDPFRDLVHNFSTSHRWLHTAEFEPGMRCTELATPIAISPETTTEKKIMREIFRALGRYYEQQRPERDRYISIHWENIVPCEKL